MTSLSANHRSRMRVVHAEETIQIRDLNERVAVPFLDLWAQSSQQELYMVSVESVPQYAARQRRSTAGGCCSRSVGKDLLCGVLIALAVICVAVAVFLIVFFVIDGT